MPTNDYQIALQTDLEFVIPAGQTMSNALDLKGTALCVLQIPAITGTSIKLYGSIKGVNYVEMRNTEGNLLQFAAGTARFVPFSFFDFAATRFIKIESNAVEAAERIIEVQNRPIS